MEPNLRLIVGLILFALNALAGISIYVSYSGAGGLSWLIGTLLCMSLESAKVLSWRRGGLQRLLSITLSLLTLLAFLGSTLMSVENTKAHSIESHLKTLHSSVHYNQLESQLQLLQAQQSAILSQMEVLPPLYVTASGKLSSSLDNLRNEQSTLTDKLTKMEAEAKSGAGADSPNLFSTLARVTGQSEALIEVVVLLLLAILVEVSGFVMLGKTAELKVATRKSLFKGKENQVRDGKNRDDVKPNPVVASQSGGVTAEEYLKEALRHDKAPYLLGRGKVAERLGITENEAKAFIEALVRDGRVRRESKYFVEVGLPIVYKSKLPN